jgi:UDP-N-acetylglucosamine 4,6-dehydratase
MKLLITGGSGTLGNALVKRLYESHQITIYSRSELLQAQMRQKYPECRYVLGDVRDRELLSAAIAGHDTVIHAAAMKRIPECEAQPGICHEVNVIGSEYVAHACNVHGIEQCIGISTDKACQPVTVYGASKLMMERIFQVQPEGGCQFKLVRYGNVLESRGSVIPLWRNQHTNGDPVTLTDRRMTRFWMSPTQAVDTILRAFELEDRCILVPKVKALPIYDMARFIVGEEVTFTEVGLRSVERLHEWLVSPDEAAREFTDCFIIDRNGGRESIGKYSYCSLDAPRIHADEFREMLAEVEA